MLDSEEEPQAPKREPRTLVRRLEQLDNVVEVASSSGNWDANEYMMGLANGLILAKHIMLDEEGDPPYLKTPEKGFLDTQPCVCDEPVNTEASSDVETRS